MREFWHDAGRRDDRETKKQRKGRGQLARRSGTGAPRRGATGRDPEFRRTPTRRRPEPDRASRHQPAARQVRRAERLFTNRLPPERHRFFRKIEKLRVSSHLVIRRGGTILQFVPFSRRAWHAGKSNYRGRGHCNDFSIGIELEGTDRRAYTDAQYRALARVVRALLAAYPTLSAERIAGHSDIAPGRKSDPGPAFKWKRLRNALAR
jgi:AmpD protein